MENLKSFIFNISYPFKIFFFFDVIILICLIICWILESLTKTFDEASTYVFYSLVSNLINFLINCLTKYNYSSYYAFKIILHCVFFYFSFIFLVFLIVSYDKNHKNSKVIIYVFIYILSFVYGILIIISFIYSFFCKKKEIEIDVKNAMNQGLIDEDDLQNNNNIANKG